MPYFFSIYISRYLNSISKSFPKIFFVTWYTYVNQHANFFIFYFLSLIKISGKFVYIVRSVQIEKSQSMVNYSPLTTDSGLYSYQYATFFFSRNADRFSNVDIDIPDDDGFLLLTGCENRVSRNEMIYILSVLVKNLHFYSYERLGLSLSISRLWPSVARINPSVLNFLVTGGLRIDLN